METGRWQLTGFIRCSKLCIMGFFFSKLQAVLDLTDIEQRVPKWIRLYSCSETKTGYRCAHLSRIRYFQTL
ncbi:unnamed protein product [Gongylonema pulchrum]|uniref:Secreted protein n=1 Tax=Gongylonema pulchrum TaxID=637853 RepID=A0A183F035_9BILA|nr:unnamed protein product [Gongylonema pulchrum]